MKVLITGASGLVGSHLVPALRAAGHQVVKLVRSRAQLDAESALWDPRAGAVDAAALAGCEGAVNLAGESIAAGRWTEKRKASIRASRVQATTTIAQALAALDPKPRVLINASAVGYYGSRGDAMLDEQSAPGGGDFLSSVCRDWEAATAPAAQAGMRVVLARFGVILSGRGGALAQMLLPFRLGVGGKIGPGAQFMSWVAIDDAVGAILHGLTEPGIAGAMNVVAPQEITNAQFTKTLGRVLARPTVLPLPALAVRIALGQMGQELLLSSQKVRPSVLLSTRYSFKYPQLEGALRHLLAR